MSFKYLLGAVVEVGVSGEVGHVKGRAQYTGHMDGYLIHYQAADGRAVDSWFDENEIKPASIDDAVQPA